jgi:hypothetical protein
VTYRVTTLDLPVAAVDKPHYMFLYHMPMSLSGFADGNPTAETRPRLVNDDIVGYVPGDMVPWHFMPGFIVASFFASLSGTLLTTELLQRRRLGKSLMSRQAPSSVHIRYIADLDAEYTFLRVH